ncbi:MAG: type I restriction enzyme HsdR N-terminal domain-containing protein [Bacteroidetes bacterium]|nr:type I restriction enzyme HsdR N-terminal domain-containing protein [Bacteroidota bacterium]
MYKIPSKVASRIATGIKNIQPVLNSASSRDVNEDDTVTIIVDILSRVLGYDKFLEVTKEFQIRGTYCDLATLINGKISLLIEVKAIGIELKKAHVKQAVDYASNEGVDWVILTNGIHWRVYKVHFTKPISQELVYDFSFLELSSKRKKDIELLYPLTKEGVIKSSLKLYHDQRQALSRFYLGALLLTDKYLTSIQRDLRKLSPGIKIEIDEIEEVLKNELFKREVIESEDVKTAGRKINRLLVKKPKIQTVNKPVTPEISTSSEDSGM